MTPDHVSAWMKTDNIVVEPVISKSHYFSSTDIVRNSGIPLYYQSFSALFQTLWKKNEVCRKKKPDMTYKKLGVITSGRKPSGRTFARARLSRFTAQFSNKIKLNWIRLTIYLLSKSCRAARQNYWLLAREENVTKFYTLSRTWLKVTWLCSKREKIDNIYSRACRVLFTALQKNMAQIGRRSATEGFIVDIFLILAIILATKGTFSQWFR